jgi:hypothetical protein
LHTRTRHRKHRSRKKEVKGPIASVERIETARYIDRMTTKPADADPSKPEANKPAEDKPPRPREIGGPKGPEPTRYGDWEVGGRCTDF